MNFLKNIGSSIHSPKFYSQIPKKTFKQGFGYFFLLILLLTAVKLIFLINPIFVETPKAVREFAYNIVNCFPQELEVKVVNGEASTNVAEPYFISCSGNKDQTVVVIDTKTPYSPSKFEEYKAYAWVTKDSVVYSENDVESRTYNLSEVKNFKLNKQQINSFRDKFEPYLKFVGPVVFVVALLGIYLTYTFRVVHLLITASLIWLLGKVSKHELSYGTSYKVGLYAITLGLIVDLVVNLTSRWTNFYGFPFMVTILTLAVVYVNLILHKNKT